MKSVPLVMYKDGVRTVIGQAEVTDDGQDLLVNATIDPEHVHILAPASEAFSISSEHAAVYGAPVATPASIGAWAQEVERYSKLDSSEA